MEIEAFFHKETNTLTYLVYDPSSKDALVIDPVLDYDPSSSSTSTQAVEKVREFLDNHGLKLHYILETHAHADHFSGGQELKRFYPEALVAIGSSITTVQQTFKALLNLPETFPTDGSQFDYLLMDGELIKAGSLFFRVIFTPGHTPVDCCYYFTDDIGGDAIFTGDTILMPDSGTGRCDFPAGSANKLFNSITQRIYTFPDETRMFVGHDYQPDGRGTRFRTNIGIQKLSNIHLPDGRSQKGFVEFRDERDSTLEMPRLLFQSVQVNIAAGKLPEPENSGVSFLKIPLNLFEN